MTTQVQPTPSLGDPIRIGRLTARNRMVATAHGIAAVVNGVPTHDDAAYWARLSAGGVGMTIAGGTQVSKETVLRSRNLTEAYRAKAMRGLRARAEAMKSGGALSVLQLGHLGQETLGAGVYYPFVAASTVRSPREPTAMRVLSTGEVRDVVEAYRVSAAHALEAGFDIVEIHAAHGYLIAQFLSSKYNTRTDKYGGNAEGRVTLLAEIVEAIRSLSPETPVGVRLSVEYEPDSGLGVDDLLDLVPRLQARAPFDYLNLSYGVRGYYIRDMATTAPPLIDVGQRFREVLNVPLLLCSTFRDKDTMTSALARGAADLIGSARAYLADPDMPRKFLHGNPADVRPCVACNEECRSFDPTATCVVNPQLAPPGEIRKPAAPILLTPRIQRALNRVAVVGAGAAGLECATTIAAGGGGTGVVLLEAADRIGGQLAVVGQSANRGGWQRLLSYYQHLLDGSPVEVRLGTSVGATELAEFDGVVWAAGAQELDPTAVGAVPTVSCYSWLAGDTAGITSPDGTTVLVADDGFGWWPAINAAETALARGAGKVLFVTPGASFGGALSGESRLQLVERLRGAPVEVVALTALTGSTTEAGVEVRNTLSGTTSSLPADLVVVVGERVAIAAPSVDGPRMWAVGDAVVPRRVSTAVAEGHELGLRLAAELAPALQPL